MRSIISCGATLPRYTFRPGQSRTLAKQRGVTNHSRRIRSCASTQKSTKVTQRLILRSSRFTIYFATGNRYACIEPTCTSGSPADSASPLYFPNWTALQAHIRERHPPTCQNPECNGRTFATQKGLKGHLKVHEEREIEAALEDAVGEDGRPKKKRRGGEIGRDWACNVDECVKSFKSVSVFLVVSKHSLWFFTTTEKGSHDTSQHSTSRATGSLVPPSRLWADIWIQTLTAAAHGQGTSGQFTLNINSSCATGPSPVNFHVRHQLDHRVELHFTVRAPQHTPCARAMSLAGPF